MIRLEMKNCNMILTEKQQKYQHHHLQKLINMNILHVKKYYLLIREQSKVVYSPLGKLLRNKQKQLKNKEENKLKL